MTIIKGEGFVLVRGNKIPFEEYSINNSKPSYEPAPRCNADGTAIPKGVVPQHKKN